MDTYMFEDSIHIKCGLVFTNFLGGPGPPVEILGEGEWWPP